MTPLEKLSQHAEAILFWKAFNGMWPGGDWQQLKAIAIELGYSAEDINISCDDCRERVLQMFYEKLTEQNPNILTEYKQRKGIL